MPSGFCNIEPIDLGNATSFVVLGYAGIQDAGASVLGGNLGLWPGTSLSTQFTYQNGGAEHVNDQLAQAALFDMAVAFLQARNRAAPTPYLWPTTSGQAVFNDGTTITCGVYKIEGDLYINGNIYLDGGQNGNSVFIFQVTGNIYTAPDSEIILINRAEALNAFWQTDGTATLGSYSLFKGTILSFCRIMADEGAHVEGRLLADSRYLVDTVKGLNLYHESQDTAFPTSMPTTLSTVR
jgi:hypothetical protein